MVLPRAGGSVVGLFAGIGGVELGLASAGFEAELFCEIDPGARAVLATRFPGVALHDDVRTLRRLPRVEILAGGFPCQDLSQAGRTAGIQGRNSGLVAEVFRLLSTARPRWLLLENVSFMLSLDGGKAMEYLTSELVSRGYAWAYRVVDTRAFGLPQRRQRVVLLASRTEAPWDVLLADETEGEPDEPAAGRVACGFYWTEGVRGLGWAWDAVPTLKGGSTIGIPSPPAIWMPDGTIVTPDLRDAERLQGFEPDWTLPSTVTGNRRASHRWKLVGNAVSTPVFGWVGRRLRSPGTYVTQADAPLDGARRWPNAAWGRRGEIRAARRSMWPVREARRPLAEFLEFPTRPLSRRATAGFLARTRTSTLRFAPGFIRAVENHLAGHDALLASNS